MNAATYTTTSATVYGVVPFVYRAARTVCRTTAWLVSLFCIIFAIASFALLSPVVVDRVEQARTALGMLTLPASVKAEMAEKSLKAAELNTAELKIAKLSTEIATLKGALATSAAREQATAAKLASALIPEASVGEAIKVHVTAPLKTKSEAAYVASKSWLSGLGR